MKKVLSVFLCVIMLFSVVTLAVSAKDATASVRVSVYDGSLLVSYETVTVEDGIAEKYGFTVPAKDHNGKAIKQSTVLDLLVALHEARYGKQFSSQNASEYLYVSAYGYLELAFKKDAAGTGFAVNDKFPNDGTSTTSAYGTYLNGYSINEARISDGDYVSFFFYQDKNGWSDAYAWFNKDSAECDRGAGVTLKLSGYSYAWYSADPEYINYVSPLAGVDIFVITEYGKQTAAGTTDSNGKIKVSFERGGKYKVVAYGKSGSVPVIPAWCEVTVEENFFDKIYNFFAKIAAFLKALFVRV